MHHRPKTVEGARSIAPERALRILSASMRRPSYGLLAILMASLGLGCRLAPPTAAEVLAAGFRTPEQTFRTFQTALRGDLEDLEYRCLSSSFKEREGITELGWREAREELLRERPWVRQVARAKIVSGKFPDADHARLVAEIDTWFADARFALSFVREDSYEIADREGPLEGAALPFSRAAEDRQGFLVLRLPFPAGTALDEIAEVHVARRWKIDSFEFLADP